MLLLSFGIMFCIYYSLGIQGLFNSEWRLIRKPVRHTSHVSQYYAGSKLGTTLPPPVKHVISDRYYQIHKLMKYNSAVGIHGLFGSPTNERIVSIFNKPKTTEDTVTIKSIFPKMRKNSTRDILVLNPSLSKRHRTKIPTMYIPLWNILKPHLHLESSFSGEVKSKLFLKRLQELRKLSFKRFYKIKWRGVVKGKSKVTTYIKTIKVKLNEILEESGLVDDLAIKEVAALFNAFYRGPYHAAVETAKAIKKAIDELFKGVRKHILELRNLKPISKGVQAESHVSASHVVKKDISRKTPLD